MFCGSKTAVCATTNVSTPDWLTRYSVCMPIILRCLIPAAVAIVVAACAAPEVLLSKSAVVPAGVDFSGQWQLSDTNGETIRQLDGANPVRAEDILKEAKRARTGRPSSSAPGSAVHVFLEAGSRLKITQTDFGIFVSFDRAIVEEYRFGEHRQVNVGPIIATRVSGWEGSAYVIETLDKDGAKLVERYRLEDMAARMVRNISLWEKGVRKLEVEPVFERL